MLYRIQIKALSYRRGGWKLRLAENDPIQNEQTGGAEPPMIELAGVTKEYVKPSGEVHTVLRDLHLRMAKGEFCSFVGPTGCGKSTTLGLIAGFEQPTGGTVKIQGEPLQGLNKQAACVFQTDNTFPWKTVIDNVSLGLRLRGISKAEAYDEARVWIERVGLKGFEKHYPHQLSGGMRKRVALAQCLIVQPQILLMDESFSALDVHTRSLMENELLTIWEETSASVVFITHDLEEAIALSDRVIVLTAGPSATIKGDYRIHLPRPRNVSEIRFDPEFLKLHEKIWNDLRDEVMISYEQSYQSR
ncbi:ABC transporter ATP-binding protein [Thermoactinomyces daqus]|jgi:NitT/TauT family transport system ATP-binding protein|uniref:ABC transporter ATP-binding protein n=1 Tax=Thermoactinomyces daqus TaxID=1329516 RepID=A0A7W1XCU6_9BACL|nr:ABC transporter ATP-binding protein [Thermoactinomyces daqus]